MRHADAGYERRSHARVSTGSTFHACNPARRFDRGRTARAIVPGSVRKPSRDIDVAREPPRTGSRRLFRTDPEPAARERRAHADALAQRTHRDLRRRSRVFDRGALLTRDDSIEWVGAESDLPAGLRPDRTIELAGRWLTPGLIDCHTHLVFAGQRAAEFARRTAGTSYAEIAREGGGILSTVRATRAASEESLLDRAGRACSRCSPKA